MSDRLDSRLTIGEIPTIDPVLAELGDLIEGITEPELRRYARDYANAACNSGLNDVELGDYKIPATAAQHVRTSIALIIGKE